MSPNHWTSDPERLQCSCFLVRNKPTNNHKRIKISSPCEENKDFLWVGKDFYTKISLKSHFTAYFKKEIQVKKVMLIIFLIIFSYSDENVQLPSRMTRMTNTVSSWKILQLFYWKPPISPPFWKGNHKNTYHLLWVMCTTSAKLRTPKFLILDGSTELLEFTSCTPQGSCCTEHSPGVTTGPSRSLDAGTALVLEVSLAPQAGNVLRALPLLMLR